MNFSMLKYLTTKLRKMHNSIDRWVHGYYYWHNTYDTCAENMTEYINTVKWSHISEQITFTSICTFIQCSFYLQYLFTFKIIEYNNFTHPQVGLRGLCVSAQSIVQSAALFLDTPLAPDPRCSPKRSVCSCRNSGWVGLLSLATATIHCLLQKIITCDMR